tara:strand:- start:124 stop:354 length:231 start_codon:yes stop_codon:yes gene_type:complete
MTQYSKDILDVETDFHIAVEKIVNELSDDVADAMRQAEKLLSTDKFKDLSTNKEYVNEQLEEFVSQLWIEHRENKL